MSRKSLLWVLGLGPGPQIGTTLLFTILHMEASVSACRMAEQAARKHTELDLKSQGPNSLCTVTWLIWST